MICGDDIVRYINKHPTTAKMLCAHTQPIHLLCTRCAVDESPQGDSICMGKATAYVQLESCMLTGTSLGLWHGLHKLGM